MYSSYVVNMVIDFDEHQTVSNRNSYFGGDFELVVNFEIEYRVSVHRQNNKVYSSIVDIFF